MEEKIVSMAREIGKLLQEEECYAKMESERIASDADKELSYQVSMAGTTTKVKLTKAE